MEARSGQQQVSVSYPSAMSSKQEDKAQQQAVRFNSQAEEIAPEASLEQIETITAPDKREREDLGPEAQEELKNLAMSLQKSRQQKRFENFAFEPVSLPPSRVSNPRLPPVLVISASRLSKGSRRI